MSDLADWLAGHTGWDYWHQSGALECFCGATLTAANVARAPAAHRAHVAEAFLGLPLQERARLANVPIEELK